MFYVIFIWNIKKDFVTSVSVKLLFALISGVLSGYFAHFGGLLDFCYYTMWLQNPNLS